MRKKPKTKTLGKNSETPAEHDCKAACGKQGQLAKAHPTSSTKLVSGIGSESSEMHLSFAQLYARRKTKKVPPSRWGRVGRKFKAVCERFTSVSLAIYERFDGTRIWTLRNYFALIQPDIMPMIQR